MSRDLHVRIGQVVVDVCPDDARDVDEHLDVDVDEHVPRDVDEHLDERADRDGDVDRRPQDG